MAGNSNRHLLARVGGTSTYHPSRIAAARAIRGEHPSCRVHADGTVTVGSELIARISRRPSNSGDSGKNAHPELRGVRAPADEIADWKRSAKAAGKTLNDWCLERLRRPV